jgi:hypothetical protein
MNIRLASSITCLSTLFILAISGVFKRENTHCTTYDTVPSPPPVPSSLDTNDTVPPMSL